MAFTAADVKNLREMTGVGMMDCKKALTEADGDMDKAVEYLREKGLASLAEEGRPHRRRGHGLRRCGWTAWASWSRSTAETDFVRQEREVRGLRQGRRQGGGRQTIPPTWMP